MQHNNEFIMCLFSPGIIEGAFTTREAFSLRHTHCLSFTHSHVDGIDLFVRLTYLYNYCYHFCNYSHKSNYIIFNVNYAYVGFSITIYTKHVTDS